MNNEELKKKIAQIISEYCCPSGKTHKQLYGDDRMCYSKMNFAECNPITECTDALIAAEIGDVKGLQAQIDVLEITNIALQAGYDDAEKDRLYWVDKYKEAEHRAEVAEMALRNCVDYYSYSGLCPILDCNYNKACWRKECTPDIEKCFMIQAEKELAEERKDD